MKHFIFIVLVFSHFLYSCSTKNKAPLFSLAENTNIDFVNSLESTKQLNVFNYRNFYNGGGVAAGDINNDGLTDVFFTANQGSNKLYLNKGDLKFEDISEKAGFTKKKQWSTGVTFVDINNDGWLDIYVCNAGNMLEPALRKNQLFINNQNLSFTESAAQYGLDNDGYTTQASFFDYDMDGDLDCFIVNNSPIPVNTLNYANMRDLPANEWQVADFLKGGGDHLYKNENGKFTEVTKAAGIHGSLISLGLGVTVGDVNGDHYPDVYVSNDFFERDYLYINKKNGTFKDELEKWTQHTSLSSMGADIQDINNDGYPDIFTTDMLPRDDYRLKANTSFENYDVFKLKQNQGFYNQFTQNALQVNNKNGKLIETAFFSGVAASDWSWGALMFDADNDGLADIYVCNGIYRDVTDQDFIDFFANDIVQQMAITGKKEDVNNIIDKMPSNPIPDKVFKNLGGLRFKDAGNDWGITRPSFSNGAVYADLDNDGDLDLVINNVNEKALVYKNNSAEQNKNNYIQVLLKSKSPNVFAIGSKIKIYQQEQIINREVIPSRGFQSSVDYKQTIGLGAGTIDSMQVIWPDGTLFSVPAPSINKLNVIYQSSHKKDSAKLFENVLQPLLEKVDIVFEKHTEDDYIDFYIERNIPFMLSRLGPKAAVGDVNGDGKEDIYIGGAKEQASQLYLQTAGGFQKKNIPDFKTYAFNDITAALFFDCDQDGDLDLFAGGGGNFANDAALNFQNQLYLNDGKGNFVLSRGVLPVSNTNCGTALVLDFDGDNKLDLFVGSRSIPQNYGESPQNFLLHNEGDGKFKDVTAEVAPTLLKVGMITAANYNDLNKDGIQELIITGDWMYPHVYAYNNNKFEEVKTGLENYFGWWQSMNVDDVDKDGDMDLLLGNLGENFYLQPDSINPVKLWFSDFDENGTVDKIFTRTVNGKDVPVFMKREITEQIPSLKKQNLKHHEYAGKTVQELFGKGIEKAAVKHVNYTASCIAYNNGKGAFTVKKLPLEVQLSSVNVIKLKDINEDGYADIVAAGNFFDLLPQFCRLDASYGHVLLNDQKGNFSTVNMLETGIDLPGQTRDIGFIVYKKVQHILFLMNNDFPVLYKLYSKKN